MTLPNSLYDPKNGHQLYNRYLDELELAAELDSTVSLSMNIIKMIRADALASCRGVKLAQRTENCKLASRQRIALREHPLTLAEEHAMIDCITGRLITSFVRGIGAEFYSWRPTLHSARQLIEAHDLIIRAWTETGPFAFEGKHYHFEYGTCGRAPIRIRIRRSVSITGFDGDHRMGSASRQEICICAELQRVHECLQISRPVPGGCGDTVRLCGIVRSDRLDSAGLCGGNGRTGGG